MRIFTWIYFCVTARSSSLDLLCSPAIMYRSPFPYCAFVQFQQHSNYFLLNVTLEVVQLPFSPHFSLRKLARYFGFTACFTEQPLLARKRKNLVQFHLFFFCSHILRQPFHLKGTAFLFTFVSGCATTRSFRHRRRNISYTLTC